MPAGSWDILGVFNSWDAPALPKHTWNGILGWDPGVGSPPWRDQELSLCSLLAGVGFSFCYKMFHSIPTPPRGRSDSTGVTVELWQCFPRAHCFCWGTAKSTVIVNKKWAGCAILPSFLPRKLLPAPVWSGTPNKNKTHPTGNSQLKTDYFSSVQASDSSPPAPIIPLLDKSYLNSKVEQCNLL